MTTLNSTTHTATSMLPITAALAELDSLGPDDDYVYTEIANRHGVDRRTLARRHQGITKSHDDKNSRQQNLTPWQEKELLLWINNEHKRGFPPALKVVQDCASRIAKCRIGKAWVGRFLHRHKDEVVTHYTTGMDRNRCQADSEWKYIRYFDLIHSKIEEYSVEQRHTYNMDEKGFLIGLTSRRLRVFSRRMYERREVTETIRDGSREWISVIACICADGTALDPGIIYQSDASTLQASWVADINPKDHSAFVTASTSG